MLVPGVNRTRNQNRAHKQRDECRHFHRSIFTDHALTTWCTCFFLFLQLQLFWATACWLKRCRADQTCETGCRGCEHSPIQTEDFAEFSVNYTDATKWFHITQRKKKNIPSKINTHLYTLRASEHYRAVRFGGSHSRDCVREQRKPSHSEGRPSLSRTNRSLRREMDGNWQQTTELSPQTKLFGEIRGASVQIEISTIWSKTQQAAS